MPNLSEEQGSLILWTKAECLFYSGLAHYVLDPPIDQALPIIKQGGSFAWASTCRETLGGADGLKNYRIGALFEREES